MSWVLIIILYGGLGRVSVATMDFTSKARCDTAAKAAEGKGAGFFKVVTICTEK